MYKETYGRYFEDFKVGEVYLHRPGRTITETDNIWFSLLTMNTHPLHLDNEYAKATEFGKAIVNSGFIISLLGGMSVRDVSQKAIANLGWTDIKMTFPLFVGDSLYAESEVISKRESKSRPHNGIISVLTTGKNQNDRIICTYKRAALVPKKGYAVDDKINY